MPSSWKSRVLKWLRVLTWFYFLFLFGWMIAHVLWGDRWWWLFVLNTLAPYLFFPLPLVLLMACLLRRREIWLGTVLAFALGGVLYGQLYLPRQSRSVTQGRTIAIMTYNVLGYNEHPDLVVDAIRDGEADLVALQELNPAVAEAVRRDLVSTYPYQCLDSRDGVGGAGVISRYPIEPSGERLPGSWVGTPQILRLNFAGRAITVLHAHPTATNPDAPAQMEQTIRERDRQARTILEFARAHAEPLIVPIDLNATDRNTPYSLLSAELSDAWRESGWGLGRTFPGAASPGSSRPVFAGIAVPKWLVRVDYVFHSAHFQAIGAWIGPWDGFSDHRPVMARLTLTDT